MKKYQEHSSLPRWWPYITFGQAGYGVGFAWSNAKAPPKIGAHVRARVNRLGEGVVTGYFTEEGFLGVLVKLDSPPEWLIKQNGPKAFEPVHLFGTELEILPSVVEFDIFKDSREHRQTLWLVRRGDQVVKVGYSEFDAIDFIASATDSTWEQVEAHFKQEA
jgi:hypothetical protein